MQQARSGRGGSRATSSLISLLPSIIVLLILASNAGASTLVPQQSPVHTSTAQYQLWHECSSQAMYGGLYGAQLLQNLTEFKSGLLSQVLSSFDPAVAPAQFKRFDPMSPFISCPPYQPLKRYGNAGDGGKLLCDLSRLRQPCVIYSLGSNGDYSFEQDVLNSTSCEVHTFDCTYNGKSIHPRHTYHKVCIGPNKSAQFKSWSEIMTSLGHRRGVDVAKIDIEGYEPPALAELRYDVPLPRQLVVEMHFLGGGPAAGTPAQMALLFMHMAGLGYGVVAKEDNIYGGDGCCAEFSFLHVERQWTGLKALSHELKLELLQQLDQGTAARRHERKTARRQLA